MGVNESTGTEKIRAKLTYNFQTNMEVGQNHWGGGIVRYRDRNARRRDQIKEISPRFVLESVQQ